MRALSGSSEDVTPSVPKAHRTWWLSLACVGASLVALGTFLPFVHLTLSDGYTFSRTDWQLGANSSVSFGGAPLLLIDVAVVLLGFFSVEGVLGSARTPRERRTTLAFQFWMFIWFASELKSSFPGTWTGVAGTSVSRGLGGWVSALGSAVLVGVYLVEVRRYGLTGPSNEPLAEREQQILARADQRRVLRAFALLVVGAVFALAIKVLLGASWPTAIIMFVVVTVFYWWQYTRRIAHLRRRREIELAQACTIDSALTLPDSQSTF
ncbi:MAG: hypothetical protein ACYC0I_00630 [Acidimicrobiales bacterium]